MTLSECNSVAWAPEGRKLVTANADGSVQVWDAQDGASAALTTQVSAQQTPAYLTTPVLTLPHHEGEANDAIFSPDGTLLFTCGDDGLIHICDSQTGRISATLRKHEREVEKLAVSSDGRLLASASSDGSVSVWDTDSGHQIYAWRARLASARMVSVCFSPDNRLVAAGDIVGHILVGHVETGQVTQAEQIDGIESLQFADDSRRLLTGDRKGTVKLWLIDTDGSGTPRLVSANRHWQAHESEVLALDVDASRGQWLSGERNGVLAAWPESTTTAWIHSDSKALSCSDAGKLITYGREIYVIDPVRREVLHAAFPQADRRYRGYSSQSPSRLLSDDHPRLAVVDLQQQRLVTAWEFPEDIFRAAVSPDGRYVALSLIHI